MSAGELALSKLDPAVARLIVNRFAAVAFIRTTAKRYTTHQAITAEDVLELHYVILMCINDAAAGRFRRSEVVRPSATTFRYTPSYDVPLKMYEFFEWLHHVEGDPVRIAAKAAFTLLSVHPFEDGNGRTARHLLNLILLIHGLPMATIDKDRNAYIDALQRGQTQHDITSWYRLVEAAVERSASYAD